jgi:hypothetical protein
MFAMKKRWALFSVSTMSGKMEFRAHYHTEEDAVREVSRFCPYNQELMMIMPVLCADKHDWKKSTDSGQQ